MNEETYLAIQRLRTLQAQALRRSQNYNESYHRLKRIGRKDEAKRMRARVREAREEMIRFYDQEMALEAQARREPDAGRLAAGVRTLASSGPARQGLLMRELGLSTPDEAAALRAELQRQGWRQDRRRFWVPPKVPA